MLPRAQLAIPEDCSWRRSLGDMLAPSNQRLHLARAMFGAVALDCSLVELSGKAAPVVRRGRGRAGETHNR